MLVFYRKAGKNDGIGYAKHMMPSVWMEDFVWRTPPVDRIEKSDRVTRLLVNELKQRLFAMDSNPLTPGMVLRLPIRGVAR